MGGKKVKEPVAQSDAATTAKAPKAAPKDTQKQQGKKKKGADRPQPAWLFPPDDENPVLNNNGKPTPESKKEIEDRLKAIDFLKKKAAGAPDRTQPPSLLIQLVGAFLGEYGFNSTSRLFNLEREGRKNIAGWEDNIGAKFAKSQPSLTKIFRDWYAENKDEIEEESTSSSSGDESSDSDSNQSEGQEEESSSSEDDLSDDDAEDKKKSKKQAKQTKDDKKGKGKTEAKAQTNGKNKKTSASSSSSSSSDSDADDETETPATKPTVNGLLEKLKARQQPSAPAIVVAKTETKKQASKSTSSSSSESESSSASSSDADDKGGVPTKARGASDSSNTLTESPVKQAASSSSDSSSSDSSSSSESDGEAAEATPVVVTTTATSKRKRSKEPEEAKTVVTSKVLKKNNTPFQRIPADTKVDPKFSSNKYQAYDYADKAHQDLIVTKGKGFTKEKNKKKRGSYRGGAIDVSGGKGIKFDD